MSNYLCYLQQEYDQYRRDIMALTDIKNNRDCVQLSDDDRKIEINGVRDTLKLAFIVCCYLRVKQNDKVIFHPYIIIFEVLDYFIFFFYVGGKQRGFN